MKIESAPDVFKGGFDCETVYFHRVRAVFCHYNSNVPHSVPGLKIHTWDKLNLSMKEWAELGVLCVMRGIKVNERWYLWTLLFYETSSQCEDPSALLPLVVSLPCTNWLEWREQQYPSCFPRWLWEWDILAFKGWENCFCQLNLNGRFTPSLFLCCVTGLEIYSWDELNLPMWKDVWTVLHVVSNKP